MAANPLETRNLADDPGLSDMREKLLASLNNRMQETNDLLLHGPVPSPQHKKAMRILTGTGEALPFPVRRSRWPV